MFIDVRHGWQKFFICLIFKKILAFDIIFIRLVPLIIYCPGKMSQVDCLFHQIFRSVFTHTV